ncbi:uncharacterized protein LOC111266561 isoform X1 [Varroa jacobsoni]|uniref:uncharacterized protein LOC111266561 isoform X1 n=1 Tax=Varroa jacobsoni TaxID=62625 RepID=UPI000BF4D499|nr:uncharacterized protein LOC111266561 isoform X1 [Varroa jacobsoni]XP_022699873.1 uncharacterized protein LOC111266561 isoform X1 [Varroa jacobsoni]
MKIALMDRDDCIEEQAPRSLKLTFPPSRVGVNPEKDCSSTRVEVVSQADNGSQHLQNYWPVFSVMRPINENYPHPAPGTEGSTAPSVGCFQGVKDVVWNWKPQNGHVFPEHMDDALHIIPELAVPPSLPPRGLKPANGTPTVTLRASRPAPLVGTTGLPQLFHAPFSSQASSCPGMLPHNHNYTQSHRKLVSLIAGFDKDHVSGHVETAQSFPIERHDFTLLRESSIYEPASFSKDSSAFCGGRNDELRPMDETNRTAELTDTARVGSRNSVWAHDFGSQNDPTAIEANCFCCCFTTFCLVMSIILLTASAVLAIIHGAEVYRRKMATLDPDTFFYTLADRRTDKRASSSANKTAMTHSCESFVVEPCIPHLPYNFTGYPNLVGHNSSKELNWDLRMFREVMDGECYPLAGLFLCHLLQPQCDSQTRQKVNPPCREFCEYFLYRCNAFVPDRIRSQINCHSLSNHNCTLRPPCSAELLVLSEGEKICDGTVDCPDHSDENGCATTAPPMLPNSSTTSL